MDLRALLFSSDGASTATLCQVLTDLEIEADICSEVLVAAQRVARENYDAIIVDWDLESDATLLLKTARGQKAMGLNLALVPNDASIGRALQHGANSVIKKPIDTALARETLSTARGLILSRRTELRDKEARYAAVQAEMESAIAEEPSAPKRGFLSQSMTRSAFEAEEKLNKADTSGELRWQAARGPASLQEDHAPEAKDIQPVGKQRWDNVKRIFRDPAQESEKTEAAAPIAAPPTQDATGIFSTLLDEPEAAPETNSSAPPRYLIFAMVACVLVAGVLYVWAPGDSYLGRANSAFHALFANSKHTIAQPETSANSSPTAGEKLVAPATVKAIEDTLPDAGPIESTDVDPSKIQIIETKVIPKPGAQQPPTTQPPPDSDQAKALLQQITSPQVAADTADVQTPPSPQPATPQTATPTPAPPRAIARTQEDVLTAPEGRVGVVIPDSLKSAPAASPASALEPLTVPEETALGLVIHRVEPAYPAQALQQRIDGLVVLQAWIAKDGSVRDLKMVKGYFVLGRAAIDAVKQWRFKPYTQNGRTTEFQTTMTVNFRSAK
jgi:protein TonB